MNSYSTVHPYLLVVQLFASLSIFCSFLVILSYLLLKNIRAKWIMKMVVYISLGDLTANFWYILPFRPHDESALCYVEGLFNSIAYRSTWFWTCAIIYVLYFLAIESRFPSQRRLQVIAAICWFVPLLVGIVSVAINKFQRPPYAPQYEICIADGTEVGDMYHVITFYGLLIFILVLIFVMSWKIRQIETTTERQALPPTYNDTRNMLSMYPIILMICWIPHAFVSILAKTGDFHVVWFETVYYIADLLKISHGIAMAVIFFYTLPEALKLWIYILCPCYRLITKMDRDFDVDLNIYRDFSFFIDQDNIRDSSSTTASSHRTFYTADTCGTPREQSMESCKSSMHLQMA